MGLEVKKKERTARRRSHTTAANRLEASLEIASTSEIKGNLHMLEEAEVNLNRINEEIRILMLETATDDEIVKECDDADGYKSRYFVLKSMADAIINKKEDSSSIYDKKKERNFKLPRLEMRKFDGNIKNWLFFWAQFRRIDEDPDIDSSDKLAYLIQAMEPGTEARTFVQNFPPTDSAYKDCIQQLKTRYAKDEMLIQVYVRELLSIVLTRSHEEYTLSQLYDSLNAQLGALETLGVTKDKYAAFLLPMIESALPQDLLRIWERSRQPVPDTATNISNLLTFLQKEVESEERINMAKTGFHKASSQATLQQEPTASCLLTTGSTGKIQSKCVWCDKQNHTSLECFKLTNMSIDQRKEHLKHKKACAICLKTGHHAKICKAHIKCIVCNQRHNVALCTINVKTSASSNLASSDSKQQAPSNQPLSAKSAPAQNREPQAALASAQPPAQGEGTTLLQTAVVTVYSSEKKMTVRALFDNGAQRSYIREDIAAEMNIPVVDVMTNFWSLETIGIRDPVESKTQVQKEEEMMDWFEENTKVNHEGRYEVHLPWKIAVAPDDRDSLRFLWWEDGELKCYRHCRLVFGLTSSPFLLSATIMKHLKRVTGELKETAQLLSKSFYVDNCITSLDTEEEAKRFEREAKVIMSQAKFNLRQWVVSPLQEKKQDEVIPVLGLEWHTEGDWFACNLGSIPPPSTLNKITKRNILSLTQRVFDPIGFTCPVTLVPRLILQESWKRKLTWDDELPADLKKKFLNWYESIFCLKDCKIPRRLAICNIIECAPELHLFCDASKVGYAACVFLRTQKGSEVTIRLISAKSRVVPPEKISIPRLELLAALIGSRLLEEARRDLNITCPEFCWTDSGVALCWIRRDLPWNTYVGNRVKEIREKSNPNNWYHIPGTSNWADVASRGCDAKQLLEIAWWNGPAWLLQSPEEWPQSPLTADESEVSRELKKTVCMNVVHTEGMTSKLNYFSKYSKIIRTVAWMLRFIKNSKDKIKITGELSYEEYETAEKTVIRLIQSENKENIEKRISHLTHFFDKDSILKIKTKLTLTDVPETTKYPTVLIAQSFIARRLVEQRHVHMQHAGANLLMADIRSRFWIIGLRQLVKSVISHCTICKRHRAKPVQAPTAPLPLERTQCSAPFETTGVDLAGPLYLQGGEKCWIVLYTCAVYRAVHLELTKSLSTEAFLMTLRRFIARRGRTKLMMSDNGTNFTGTKNLLSAIDWDKVIAQSAIQRIKWKLNAPAAAWWGGYWERLIRILKDLLKRVLGKSSIGYEEMETLLCDCESTMNSRPLTYIDENLEPLKPVHFLQPLGETDTADLDEIDNKNLNKRLQYLQKLREDFRQRFKTEYLTTLVQKGKERKDSLKIGDVVLIETDDKRVKWPIGIVVDLFTGRDGVSRTARVKTSSGFKPTEAVKMYSTN